MSIFNTPPAIPATVGASATVPTGFRSVLSLGANDVITAEDLSRLRALMTGVAPVNQIPSSGSPFAMGAGPRWYAERIGGQLGGMPRQTGMFSNVLGQRAINPFRAAGNVMGGTGFPGPSLPPIRDARLPALNPFRAAGNPLGNAMPPQDLGARINVANAATRPLLPTLNQTAITANPTPTPTGPYTNISTRQTFTPTAAGLPQRPTLNLGGIGGAGGAGGAGGSSGAGGGVGGVNLNRPPGGAGSAARAAGGGAGGAGGAGAGNAAGAANQGARARLGSWWQNLRAGNPTYPGSMPGSLPNPSGWQSWSSLASRIAPNSTGRVAGLARAGVGSGVLPGLAAGLAFGVGEQKAAEAGNTYLSNAFDSLGSGVSAGSMFGPIGAAVGGAAGLIEGTVGRPVANLLRRGMGKGETNQSSFDILASSGVPVVENIGQWFGGEKSVDPVKVFYRDTVINAATDMGLDPETIATLGNDYDRALEQARIYNSLGIDPSTGAPLPEGPVDDELVKDAVARQFLQQIPNYRAQAEQQTEMMNRALAYQAMLGPLMSPMQERYNQLAELALTTTGQLAPQMEPAIGAAMMNNANLMAQGFQSEALATEQMLRALPAYEAMQGFQSMQNQLGQQALSQLVSSVNNSGMVDPLADPTSIALMEQALNGSTTATQPAS